MNADKTYTIILTHKEYLAMEIAMDNRAEHCADRAMNCDQQYWDEQEKLADSVLDKLRESDE